MDKDQGKNHDKNQDQEKDMDQEKDIDKDKDRDKDNISIKKWLIYIRNFEKTILYQNDGVYLSECLDCVLMLEAAAASSMVGRWLRLLPWVG